VTYDAYSYVSISVPYDYFNSTCGLCGNFNLHPEDDFCSPSGEILSSDVDFANSWKVQSDTDPECHNVRCTGLACAVCTTDEMTLYSDSNHCGILEDVVGPFADCHPMHAPQTYIENCVYDLCLGGGYQPILCQALNVYATQCQQQGVQLGQWRQQGFCEIQCPVHSHFEPQGTGCPATCSNPSAPMNCPLPSQESCICDPGYILSAGECVPEANCGCIFEGFYYAEGQSVVLDGDCGRQCVCSSMSMTCHQHQCGPAEVCGVHEGVRGCRPTGYATCSVEDLGSYHTFDGQSFRYSGACGLTLTRVMGPSLLPHFVYYSVDGQMVGLPISVGSGQIRIYHSSVRGFVLETNFGVTVRADWPHIVRITAPSTYSGTLGGLCGNLNGDIADEFYTPDAVLLNDTQLFADSWRDGSLSAHCEDPNDSWETGHYQNSSQFIEHCSIMAKHDGPFVECSRAIDPQQRIADCVQLLEQTQGAREALCEALRGYTLLCQQNGIAVEEWRIATHCGKHYLKFAYIFYHCHYAFVIPDPSCPANSHYVVCGTSCPASCPSLSFPFQCALQCQEGCQCNDGNVLNGDRCVPPVGCGCYHSGRYRQAGETFWHGEECQFLCVCDGITGNVHCTPSSCSEVEVCHVLDGEYGCHPRPHARCSASGDPHYMSFDKSYFDFQGTCRYVLATVCNDTTGLPHFQVDARNEAWHGLPVSITVEIFVIDKNININDNFVNLPILLDSGRVSVYSSAQYIFVSTDFGLSVGYSGSWAVDIIVPADYGGVTCGICGNFNGQSNDDFMTPSGALVRSADQFGASWKVEDELPCNDGCGNHCPLCQDQTTSRSLCDIIRSREGPFSFCHVYVDPQAYFDDCVFDVCLSGNHNDVLCRSIQTYASACQSNNAVIYPWRESASFITCPENSHYELCGTDCGHTCASNIDASCEHTCSEGCFCDDGLVRSGGLCVPVEQCGCLLNGFYFNLEDSFWSDATCQQRCTCTSSGLQCSHEPCSYSQACRPAAFQYSCQNIQRQTCTISGDPHYYTFDYQVFHFQGTCTYVLSEACGSSLPYYRIEGKNEHRGSTHVSWTRMVRVFVYDEVIELVKDHYYDARVNGSFAATPFTLRNGSIQVYRSGFSLAISTDFGLVVTYDAYSYVSISVPYDYFNSTCGLCGNFNLHPEDDFRSPSGEILSSDVDFANSWKVQSDTDPECHNVRCTGLACAVCTTDEMTLYSDSNHCGILEDVFGHFGACHSVHAPQTYIENCVYDLCLGGGYLPILCQALNVYATQCQQQGVQLGQWRQQGFCEIQCPVHSHFEPQGTGCLATCSNPSAPMNCPLPSQESCICDPGYILSAGECVPEANCGCIFESFYYAEGQSVVLDGDCGRQCVCSSMSMTCHQHQCGPAEVCGVHDGVRGCRPTGYATCSVEDLGSYHTFDGQSFRYPGACGLTLSRVMGPSSLPHFVLTVEKVPRGLQDFSRVLKFEAEGIQVSIEMGEGSNVKVNVRGFVLETNFGVTVRADWPHIVRITAPSTYSGTLGGLCGNLNGDIADEFYTPDTVLLNDTQLFADSWRDGSLSAHCEDPNDSWETGHYQNSSQFIEHCSIMAKHDGPFVECSRAIDPQQRIADCVQLLEQTQGAREALCEALRGYTLLCQQNGIAVEEWRIATHCGKHHVLDLLIYNWIS
uniref:Si:dkey-239b22.1 n=1 Tax=Sinocyclocheilus grahami TaxID=75366 RepID=A0A672M6D1_SINGR